VSLRDGDATVFSQEEKAAVLHSYFEAALGTGCWERGNTVNLEALGVLQLGMSDLELPFSEEEV
jgi:hypothetical protein